MELHFLESGLQIGNGLVAEEPLFGVLPGRIRFRHGCGAIGRHSLARFFMLNARVSFVFVWGTARVDGHEEF